MKLCNVSGLPLVVDGRLVPPAETVDIPASRETRAAVDRGDLVEIKPDPKPEQKPRQQRANRKDQ